MFINCSHKCEPLNVIKRAQIQELKLRLFDTNITLILKDHGILVLNISGIKKKAVKVLNF
jgi:hypothetical protein